MSTNIEKLLAKADEIGSTEVPTGKGSSPEVQDALMQLFKAYPKSWFRSKKLGEILVASGYEVGKVSDVLFNMRVADKIQSPKKGVYGFNEGVHIDHPTPGSKSVISAESEVEPTEE